MGPKKQGFWPRINCSQMKLPDDESQNSLQFIVTVLKKVPIYDFQSEFSMSKIIPIFLKLNFIEEYQFRHTFFVKSIFC